MVNVLRIKEVKDISNMLCVGSGASGKVYTEPGNTDYAYKVIDYKYDDGYENIMYEIGIQYKLRGCGNVLQLKGFWENVPRKRKKETDIFTGKQAQAKRLEYTKYVVIVSEYMEMSLFSLFPTLKNNTEVAMGVFRQIIDGVNQIHSCGVVHGDLTPKNIMGSNRDEGCIVKIIDFGLSTLEGEYGFGTTAAYEDPLLTAKLAQSKTGYVTMNKVHDIYSLGIVAWNILTGVYCYIYTNKAVENRDCAEVKVGFASQARFLETIQNEDLPELETLKTFIVNPFESGTCPDEGLYGLFSDDEKKLLWTVVRNCCTLDLDKRWDICAVKKFVQ